MKTFRDASSTLDITKQEEEANTTADKQALNVAQVIHHVAQSEQTILFGSRARGDHRPESDIDVLLIRATTPPDEWLDKIRNLARTIQKASLPEASGIDVICMTPEEFNRKRFLRNNLANSIAKHGVNVMPGENLGYSAHYEEERIDWEDVAGKMNDASGAADGLKSLQEAGILETFDDKQVGRIAQNALENAYKSVLGAHGYEYPTSGRDGHNLRILTELIRGNFSIPDDDSVPGENHHYLTEFGGAAMYAHEHPPLDKERIAREVPEAVERLRAMLDHTDH